MKSPYRHLDDCHTATGTVVVIDVQRAFSTAAYAFSLGAREIPLAGTVEEALSLRAQIDKFHSALPIEQINGQLFMRCLRL